jgi:hypothetical protein
VSELSEIVFSKKPAHTQIFLIIDMILWVIFNNFIEISRKPVFNAFWRANICAKKANSDSQDESSKEFRNWLEDSSKDSCVSV